MKQSSSHHSISTDGKKKEKRLILSKNPHINENNMAYKDMDHPIEVFHNEWRMEIASSSDGISIQDNISSHKSDSMKDINTELIYHA